MEEETGNAPVCISWWEGRVLGERWVKISNMLDLTDYEVDNQEET